MKDNLPPFGKFIQHILEEHGYPGLTVIVDLDAESYDEVPFVSWTFINQGQRDHGLWVGILALTVLCMPEDAGVILPHLYKQTHQWELPDRGELSSASLGIESVTDSMIFDEVNLGILNGKDVAQHNAQFRLLVRDFS